MERYEKLEMEIIEFETEDVIVASNPGSTRSLDFLDLFYQGEGNENGNGN